MLQLLRSDAGVIPDINTFTILMDTFCGLECYDSAYKLFKQLIRSGVEPTHVTCAIIIKVFGATGRLDDALHVYSVMQRKGLMMSEAIYSTVVQACIAHKDYEKGLAVHLAGIQGFVSLLLTAVCFCREGLWANADERMHAQ